jgi:hypothetical protein
MVVLHMTSGMAFPKLDTAIKPDRVARAVIRVDGQTSAMQPTAGGHSLDFRSRVRSTGLAMVAVDLQPRSLELTPSQVTEYLDEIGADADLRRQWNDRPEPKRWREIYSKHAKSFVRVDKTDDSWKQPAGLTLELMPLADPTSLHAGDTLSVRLVESGRPLANFPVGVVHESDPHGTLLKTDSGGEVAVPLPKAGRYMLRATDLRPAQRADADWISDFTTLTINVR